MRYLILLDSLNDFRKSLGIEPLQSPPRGVRRMEKYEYPNGSVLINDYSLNKGDSDNLHDHDQLKVNQVEFPNL